MIDGSPQIVMFPFGEDHFVEVSLVAKPRTTVAELISVPLTTLAAPFANRLLRYDDTAFSQYSLDITEAQAEAEIPPHRVADDVDRKAVVLIFRGSRRYVQAVITSYQAAALQASQEVDNA